MKPLVLSRELSLSLAATAIAASALLLVLAVGAPPRGGAGALAELALGAPMALWLTRMTAQSLHDRAWHSLSGGAILRASDPAAYWAATAAAIASAAVFSVGFVRAGLTIALMP